MPPSKVIHQTVISKKRRESLWKKKDEFEDSPLSTKLICGVYTLIRTKKEQYKGI